MLVLLLSHVDLWHLVCSFAMMVLSWDEDCIDITDISNFIYYFFLFHDFTLSSRFYTKHFVLSFSIDLVSTLSYQSIFRNENMHCKEIHIEYCYNLILISNRSALMKMGSVAAIWQQAISQTYDDPVHKCTSGPRLNIKTVFPRYGDSHVKDKTVGETVLSLTWESLYW